MAGEWQLLREHRDYIVNRRNALYFMGAMYVLAIAL
jgi:hypothetical protein